jgi:hypothetical protein
MTSDSAVVASVFLKQEGKRRVAPTLLWRSRPWSSTAWGGPAHQQLATSNKSFPAGLLWRAARLNLALPVVVSSQLPKVDANPIWQILPGLKRLINERGH